jgi:hypothetical protein
VADYSNHRVLAFDAAAVTNGEEAIRVLGQTDFTTATAGLSASKFNLPFMVTLNTRARQLYVSDLTNSRVLIFPTRYAFAYSASSFAESAANDGTIGTSVSVTLTGESFASSSGVLTRDVGYSIVGLPAGLTEVITITSASTATISFTGAATDHESSNNISNITLTFLSPALKNVAASSVEGNTTTFSMSFTNTGPCFGGVLAKPKVKIKGKNATVQLPAGMSASASCPITARATSKVVKKPRSKNIRVGRTSALFAKLPRGRWVFDYRVTTTKLGSTQASSSAKASIK